jgi:hypothetical protein
MHNKPSGLSGPFTGCDILKRQITLTEFKAHTLRLSDCELNLFKAL